MANNPKSNLEQTIKKLKELNERIRKISAEIKQEEKPSP
jgi:ABC-type Zn uptake system ZnuABC Zn-binding protein ZnuA